MKTTGNNYSEGVIKFKAPKHLKISLIELANERNIALSALLRLITSEYIKRNRA